MRRNNVKFFLTRWPMVRETLESPEESESYSAVNETLEKSVNFISICWESGISCMASCLWRVPLTIQQAKWNGANCCLLQHIICLWRILNYLPFNFKYFCHSVKLVVYSQWILIIIYGCTLNSVDNF